MDSRVASGLVFPLTVQGIAPGSGDNVVLRLYDIERQWRGGYWY